MNDICTSRVVYEQRKNTPEKNHNKIMAQACKKSRIDFWDYWLNLIRKRH